MELTLKVDKQGRTALPKEVRQTLGINGNTEKGCRVVGNKITLEKFSPQSIHKAFAELEEIAPGLELYTVKIEGKDKYVDREYALRKIGLRSNS